VKGAVFARWCGGLITSWSHRLAQAGRIEWIKAQFRVVCGEHRLIAIARKRRLSENVRIRLAGMAMKDRE